MLVNLNDVLLPARKNGYGVGLFNTVNLELARGVLKAAEELKSPVIIGTAEILLPCGPLEDLAGLLVPMAKKASVPVVVHYDHGLTFEKYFKYIYLHKFYQPPTRVRKEVYLEQEKRNAEKEVRGKSKKFKGKRSNSK